MCVKSNLSDPPRLPKGRAGQKAVRARTCGGLANGGRPSDSCAVIMAGLTDSVPFNQQGNTKADERRVCVFC